MRREQHGKLIASAAVLFGSIVIAKDFFCGPMDDVPDVAGLFLWIGWLVVMVGLVIALAISAVRHGWALFMTDIGFALSAALLLPSVAVATFLGAVFLMEMIN